MEPELGQSLEFPGTCSGEAAAAGMNQLVFGGEGAVRLRSELLSSQLESAAVVLANPVPVAKNSWRLLVTDVEVVPSNAYQERSEGSIVLPPEYLARFIKKARVAGRSMVFVHTHPWDGPINPSPIDRQGELDLLPTVFDRVPGVPHGRLILGRSGHHAALLTDLASESPLEVIDIGKSIYRFNGLKGDGPGLEEFDRQVRVFGVDGQRRVESFSVAIVGLGGTGSIVAQELAHLGVRKFLLIDPDVLELSNLNRVVSATPSDVGHSKVSVAESAIVRVNPRARVETIQDTVLKNSVARELLRCDLFFICTDSHGSRAILNQFAYQYLVPGFDLGIQIDARKGRVSQMSGRVQMLAPGLACLVCTELLDPEEVRRDLMSELERRADPYIPGVREPQPAVISLNSTVASLAVTMYLAAVAGIPARSRYQVVRFDIGVVRSIENKQNPDCVVCSPRGALGRGDSWDLPGRKV